MVSLVVEAFSVVGFSGSRASASAVAAAEALFPLVPESAKVLVGCAPGVDLATRLYFRNAEVFEVKEFGGLNFRAALAARSAAMVKKLHSLGGLLIAFPSGVCPSAVRPSPRFFGSGSGTWGSIAFAAGIGCPVLVVLPQGISVPPWLSSGGIEAAPSVWFLCPDALKGYGPEQGVLF